MFVFGEKMVDLRSLFCNPSTRYAHGYTYIIHNTHTHTHTHIHTHTHTHRVVTVSHGVENVVLFSPNDRMKVYFTRNVWIESC